MGSVVKLFSQPANRMRRLIRIGRLCRRVRPLFSREYRRVFRRAVRLCRQERFLPDEAFRLGLFDPTLSEEELAWFVSRKKLTRVQESLNPVSWAPLLKDKSLLYRYCQAVDIPIPELYAIYFKGMPGWSNAGLFIEGRDDWARFINDELPHEFIIKPAQSALGKGVMAFRRSENVFVDAAGKRCSALDICDLMSGDCEFDCFVIQQRLRNHPELIRLSGNDNLQTVRFISFVDMAGKADILQAQLKLITGGNVTDNFEYGLTGNIQAQVSLADGKLTHAITIVPDGSGIKTVAAHPQTDICFAGFQLPFWAEACRLVKRAALKFSPIRTIGWDIALTPDGPLVLEGNIWWNPPNQHKCMDRLLDTLCSDLPKSC